MLLVGLTGGIGSGKSTVAAMLQRRGAVVFDADDFARQAVAPRTAGFGRVVETFGNDVLAPDGGLDRSRLAAVVFADPQQRVRLEAIVHPEVGRLLQEALEPYRGTDRIVVYDVPLLVENHLESMFDLVVVVTGSEDVRVGRLMRRGLSEEDARSRIRAQISDDERNAVADVVIPNEGTETDLEGRVDDLWQRLLSSASGNGSGGLKGRSGHADPAGGGSEAASGPPV
jgi:dephospho-CoA kinase